MSHRAGSRALLDEPFLALDAHRVGVLEGMVLRAAARGQIVVVSSHELLPLSRCSTELLALAKGRVANLCRPR